MTALFLIGLPPLTGLQATINSRRMKRLFYLLAALAVVLTSCKEIVPIEETKTLTVTPEVLTFGYEGGSQILTLTTDAGSWTLSKTSDSDWCRPASTSGRTSTSINVKVDANTGDERAAELVFSAPDCQDVTVTVTQKAGSEGPDTGKIPEGISVDPAEPDADASAVIYFKAASSSPLYGYSGGVYVHIGVIVDGEW